MYETAIIARPKRLLSGHPWVFSNELDGSPRRFTPGALLELRDKKGAFLAIGYVNPASLISIRVLTRNKEEINQAFFENRIRAALDYRRRIGIDIGHEAAFRAIFSEADLLPGLIVDKFGSCLCVQLLTLGMESLADVVIKALEAVFAPAAIVLKNDSAARTLEGLALEKRVIKGALTPLPRMTENGVTIEIDPMSGQKTGFFLDQRENRTVFAAIASNRKGDALDLFCYTGAWSLQLAKAGLDVTGIDSSEQAIAQARHNASLNGLDSRCEFIRADIFGFLKSGGSSRRYSSVVLDPPALVKSKTKIAEATRGYRELNAGAMRLLEPGGLLATSSCSYHVDRAAFMEILRAAAGDAKMSVRVIEVRGQAKDHPISLSTPETEYLKCVILEVNPKAD
ncbi:MAG: class I SAM-dependent rRNA methyltransferase [Deltaproteobacteria bacterium]|nr:class I SAM-dependent rRNA methyltransferase [Deltaproteobacteria bacterium]